MKSILFLSYLCSCSSRQYRTWCPDFRLEATYQFESTGRRSSFAGPVDMYSVTRQILICKRVCDGDFLSTMTFLSLSKLYYGYIEQISSERHDLNRRNHSQSLEIAPENVVEATLSGRFDMKPCLRFMLITIFRWMWRYKGCSNRSSGWPR